ncbi:unnamed protein product [[Candida] boidinii]|nr:unnamed protein product [[Candida] boidinii]
MTWLRTQRQKENAIKLSDENTGNGLNNDNNDDNDKDDDDDDDDDEPDWVKQAYREKIIKNILTQAEDYERHLQKLEKEGSELITNELEDKNLKSLNLKKRKLNNKNNLNNNSIVEIDENNCILDNYNSDDEEYNNNNSINKFKNSNQLKLDNEIKELLLKLDNNNSTSNELIDKSTDLNESNYKIFFSSRTHSQLDQFADQLKLIKNFPSSLPNINEKIKYLPLGSRKQLCINEEIIQNYTNINDINDACLNLQKAKTNNNKDGDDSQKKNGCKYYINNNNKQPQQQQDFNQKLKNNFRDLTFSSIHDIEDLNKIEKY